MILTIDKNERLSPNFTVGEMIRSQTATRAGINNIPMRLEIENAKLLANNVFEPVRANFGSFSPQSWFRGPDLEKLICAKSIERWLIRNAGKTVEDYLAKKDHPKGFAGDIEKVGVSNYDLAKWIRDNCQYKQLILEYPDPDDPRGGWVHVSHDPANQRMEVLTRTKTGWLKGLVI